MANVRSKLKSLMLQTLEDERLHGTWRYWAVRPMYVPASWKAGQRVTGDCSKGVQYLCRWAGGPDPMRNGWSAYGNSNTIWLHLHHVDHPSELEVGDCVTFGAYGNEHAAMVLEAGPDPLLWSFGHQGAPNTVRLSWDRRPHQLLKLPVIDPPPTPQDKLRAMTGYFAWVKWKLGEGEWKHYAPATKTVRPNVPKRIPLIWWKNYAQFLLNRKKAN